MRFFDSGNSGFPLDALNTRTVSVGLGENLATTTNNQPIAQPTNEIVANLGFGNVLMSHVYIGSDEAMSGIQYFGIVTIWHDHPIYGTHAQAGVITYHPDTGEWYKDRRERFSADDYPQSVNPEFTCIKHARARMYEMVAHDLKAYAWNVESRRD